MRFELSAASPVDEKADLLALACDDAALEETAALEALDRALGGWLGRAIKEERFRAKPGQTLVTATQGRLPAARLALIGVGKRATVTPPALRAFAGRAARLAQSVGAT